MKKYNIFYAILIWLVFLLCQKSVIFAAENVSLDIQVTGASENLISVSPSKIVETGSKLILTDISNGDFRLVGAWVDGYDISDSMIAHGYREITMLKDRSARFVFEANQAPNVSISAKTSIAPSEKCSFTGSYKDNDGNISFRRWYFEQGSIIEGAPSSLVETFEHTFLETGIKTIGLRVRDNDGKETVAYHTIVVEKISPTTNVSSVEKQIYDSSFTMPFSSNSDGEYSFSSSNESVATVNENGFVSIKNSGSTIITLETRETQKCDSSVAYGNLTVKEAEVVIPNAPSISAATSTSITLVKEEGVLYRVNDGEFTSSNIFMNLIPDTLYTFYAKNIAGISNSSTYRTKKTDYNDPVAKIIINDGDEGVEYWSDSNITFKALNVNGTMDAVEWKWHRITNDVVSDDILYTKTFEWNQAATYSIFLRVCSGTEWSEWVKRTITINQAFSFGANNLYEHRELSDLEKEFLISKGIEFESSSKKYLINIDIFRDTGKIVYGEYMDVLENDFREGSENLIHDGYFIKDGVLGEYRYLGYTESNHPYTNHDFVSSCLLDLNSSSIIQYSLLEYADKKDFNIIGLDNKEISHLKDAINYPMLTKNLQNRNVNNNPNPMTVEKVFLDANVGFDPYSYGLVNEFNKYNGSITMYFKRDSGTYDYRTFQGVFDQSVAINFQEPTVLLESSRLEGCMNSQQENVSIEGTIDAIIADQYAMLSEKEMLFFYTRDDVSSISFNISLPNIGRCDYGTILNENEANSFSILKKVVYTANRDELVEGDNNIFFNVELEIVYSNGHVQRKSGIVSFVVTKESNNEFTLFPLDAHEYNTSRIYTAKDSNGENCIIELIEGDVIADGPNSFKANSGIGSYTLRLSDGVNSQDFVISLKRAMPVLDLENCYIVYGDNAKRIIYSSNSDGSVSFECDKPYIATIEGDKVKAHYPGITEFIMKVGITDNYEANSITRNIEVDKGQLEPPSRPIVSEITTTSALISSDKGSRVVLEEAEDESPTRFDSLEPGKGYSTYAYFPENDYYYRSENSQKTYFTTMFDKYELDDVFIYIGETITIANCESLELLGKEGVAQIDGCQIKGISASRVLVKGTKNGLEDDFYVNVLALPVAIIDGPSFACEPKTYTFDGANSYTLNLGDEIVSYRWNIDGEWHEGNENVSVYIDKTTKISLVVVNKDNRESKVVSHDIIFDNNKTALWIEEVFDPKIEIDNPYAIDGKAIFGNENGDIAKIGYAIKLGCDNMSLINENIDVCLYDFSLNKIYPYEYEGGKFNRKEIEILNFENHIDYFTFEIQLDPDYYYANSMSSIDDESSKYILIAISSDLDINLDKRENVSSSFVEIETDIDSIPIMFFDIDRDCFDDILVIE